MLTVKTPATYHPERAYILEVILKDFLGLAYQLQVGELDRVIINTDDGSTLSLSDLFFSLSPTNWLQPASLPSQPLKTWQVDRALSNPILVSPSIPIVYGDDPNVASFFTHSDGNIELGLDIFGSSFFMLTRYEEVVKKDRDAIDRFPLTASLAAQAGFLDRPIVNEYVEILWACLKLICPQLERKQHQFATLVSHDLDEPFLFAGTGIPRLLQRCAGDLFRRKSLALMASTLSDWMKVTGGDLTADPYNTFDMIMDISEENNLKSAFYFIADRTAGSIDGLYDLDRPRIRQLMRRIHDRGHEIGLHTSYNTYQDSRQTRREFEILRRACEAEGIEQSAWGGRQHCLRWETPTTFRNWDEAGLDYDSTLTYAEKIGFRTGTCYQYSVFDLVNKKQLKLQERPLCIMDVTVTRSTYMGLNIDSGAALAAMQVIKDRCKLFDGLFTVLWHNTGFVQQNELNLYRQIVSS
jgi:peptidoglycan/xylan/chitin deacetylase (PgdA/CDA1 family)